ncbi:ras-like protein rasD [Saccostrea echinata]|uniref:ras-like protein rasD n=1 Tax=Saccostrea echinata TaxID=191078 RepID=UPI002A8047DE|nr:ras-like protein rasD [Saccostrea echinata]
MKVLRVVVLGANRVGKTTLVKTFLQSSPDHSIESNVSKDVHSKMILFPDGLYHRVEFVDISNLDEFPSMKEVYIQTGDAFVVMYAVDNQQSYDEAQVIRQEITRLKGRCFDNIVMVGNKLDIKSTRKISTEKACDNIPETCLFTETSAKLGLNVHCPFTLLFDNYLQSLKEIESSDVEMKRCKHYLGWLTKSPTNFYILGKQCGMKSHSTNNRDQAVMNPLINTKGSGWVWLVNRSY